jgi:hypothetical protein
MINIGKRIFIGKTSKRLKTLKFTAFLAGLSVIYYFYVIAFYKNIV